MAPAATRSDAIGSRCVWTVIPVAQEVAGLVIEAATWRLASRKRLLESGGPC